eukprot:6290819-Pyramimonas_sp.AAC.1
MHEIVIVINIKPLHFNTWPARGACVKNGTASGIERDEAGVRTREKSEFGIPGIASEWGDASITDRPSIADRGSIALPAQERPSGPIADRSAMHRIFQ